MKRKYTAEEFAEMEQLDALYYRERSKLARCLVTPEAIFTNSIFDGVGRLDDEELASLIWLFIEWSDALGFMMVFPVAFPLLFVAGRLVA